jgi:hypothetical protein
MHKRWAQFGLKSMNHRILIVRLLLATFLGLLGCQNKSNETLTEDNSGQAIEHDRYDSLYGRPLIVLVEANPWPTVIGSDVPTFAMYEKGQIIYKTIEDRSARIFEVVLPTNELQLLIDKLVPSDDINDIDDYIETSDATDQPSTTIMLNYPKEKTITVYGHLGANSEDRESVPDDFLALYDSIKSYRNKAAIEWQPKQLEIMFWEYDYAPIKRPWIEKFPDLNSSTTIKVDSNFYRVYIDRKDFDEFKKYYKSMGEKQAVEINGRKMAMSYRLPFPSM